ncbi:MAG: efflux transporter outer membrane subunit [Alteraurantiacibacter sp.]
MRWLALLPLAALAGCVSLAPEPEVPVAAAVPPVAYVYAETVAEYRPEAWWQGFEDPVLDTLVEDALAANFDIAESAARVAQASAQARLARSALLPNVNGGADASYSNAPLSGNALGGLAGPGSGIDRIENDSYSLSLGAAYELDLFGRARNDLGAARRDALAAAQDLRSVRLAVAAETISAYFDVVDSRRRIALTLATAELLQDRAARTNERFERGLVESFELYQVRQDLRSVQSSLPQLESALAAQEGRLAVLLGTSRAEVLARMETRLTPRLVFDPVPSGLPADLLAQRPDIGAAWARLEASRLRIGARRAERYPAPSLNASLGTQGGTLPGAFDIVNNWAASLAASIVAPLFDGGRTSANIEVARAQYDANAATYARAVVTAYAEVESALADYEEQRQRYRLTTAQLAEAQGSLDLQRRRYAAGVGSYLAYLDALRAVQQVETSLSSAARATALARLGVHRSLGGDWAPDIPVTPVAMQPVEEPQE